MSYAADSIGQETETPTARLVYANEYTMSATENYEAARAGLKPEREFQLRAIDYADEALVSVDGVEYRVVRAAYSGEWVRLVCERRMGSQVAAVS